MTSPEFSRHAIGKHTERQHRLDSKKQKEKFLANISGKKNKMQRMLKIAKGKIQTQEVYLIIVSHEKLQLDVSS